VKYDFSLTFIDRKTCWQNCESEIIIIITIQSDVLPRIRQCHHGIDMNVPPAIKFAFTVFDPERSHCTQTPHNQGNRRSVRTLLKLTRNAVFSVLVFSQIQAESGKFCDINL
jgi:hypothetical protein